MTNSVVKNGVPNSEISREIPSSTSDRDFPVLQRPHAAKAWALLAFILALQWMLFLEFIRREITWAYPGAFDQGAYLSLSYDSYERLLSDGPLNGLWPVVMAYRPQGIMLHSQAAVLFLVVGPSRQSALTLNFLYFAVLQLVLAYTMLWLTGRFAFALIAIGLLLSVKSPFYFAGGLSDFRIDFIAFSLYGTFLCLVILSNTFHSRSWSILVAFTAALVVLFRFLTLTYFAATFAVLLVFLVLRLRRERAVPDAYRRTFNQIYNLLISGGLLLLAVAPVMWHNRDAIYQYYVEGFLRGDSAIRAEEFVPGGGLLKHLLYYPKSLLSDHTGFSFVFLCCLVLTVTLFMGRRRLHDNSSNLPAGLDLSAAYCTVGAALACPLLILTRNESKSPVVASILVVPLLLLVLLAVATRIGRHRSASPAFPKLLAALAGLTLLCGLLLQVHRYGRHGHYSSNRPDIEQVLALYDAIAEYCRTAGWGRPVISTDSIVDYLSAQTIEAAFYERYRLALDVQGGLGGSIFAISLPEAIDQIRRSDFAIMTTSGRFGPHPYPFEQTIAPLRPAVIEASNKQLMALRQFRIFGRDVTLYARPSLRLEGDSGGWITSQGLSLHSLGDVLRSRPRIELLGHFFPQFLKRIPQVTARLVFPGSTEPLPISASLAFPSANEYHMTLSLDPKGLPSNGPVQIQVGFDTYFVPKDLGINEDTRELVVPTPTTIRFAN
jgi:hypothetical protein